MTRFSSRKLGRRLLLAVATLATSTLMLAGLATPAQAATSVAYPTTYYFGSALIDGNNYHSAVVGNNGTLKLAGYLGWRYYPGYKVKAHVNLQRKIGSGSWITVKKSLPVSAAGTVRTTTPKYATKATSKTVSYRFKSLKYSASSLRGVAATRYSPTLKITYQNQQRYTGLRAQGWNIVKAYCPHTAISIGNPSNSEAGHYRPGTLQISVQSEIASYPSADKATVFLHECAHERQFVNWGSTTSGWLAMQRTMPKYFVNDAAPSGAQSSEPTSVSSGAFDAVEHAADCAALSVDPAGYLGYGGYCNSKELSYGKALITGRKF